MNLSKLITAGGLAATAALPSAWADVTVFQPQQAPLVLKSDGDLRAGLSILTQLLPGAKSQVTYDEGRDAVFAMLRNHPETFGLSDVSTETLKLVRTTRDEQGLALRFQQMEGGVPVEGAELIALFDAKDKLIALNSSLARDVYTSFAPAITPEEAVEAAAPQLDIESPEVLFGDKDGLKIAKTAYGHELVWQFSVRDAVDGANPKQVRVIADGPRTGEVLQAINIGNSLQRPADVIIYDASVTIVMPNPIYKGVKVMKNGKRWGLGALEISKEPKKATIAFDKTLNYFAKTYNRKGYDGNGIQIRAAVNVQRYFKTLDVLGMRENAAWIGPWKMFAIGAGGSRLGNFAESTDVIAHEFTHAVVSSTADLAHGGQPGALNEHLSDVFGASVARATDNPANPYLIGAKTLKGEFAKRAAALRDMENPHKGLSPQPASMAEMPEEYKVCTPSQQNDNCGVHDLNGIPNRAFALMTKRIGWETAEKLIYRTMTVRLRSTSDFADYRNQVVDECDRSLPAASCKSVRDSFAAVGL